jgi:hypothetical protein
MARERFVLGNLTETFGFSASSLRASVYVKIGHGFPHGMFSVTFCVLHLAIAREPASFRLGLSFNVTVHPMNPS